MSQPIQRILFPTDFSPCAEGAYRHAAFLAERFGAELHVLHAVESEAAPERDWPEAPGTGHLRITMADVCQDLGLLAPVCDEDAGDPFDLDGVVETEVVGRDPAEAILDVAVDEEADLVVMGTHGRRGWRRGVLGSVAEEVARHAPCPVLTVRPLDAPGGVAWPPRRVLAAVDGEAFGVDPDGVPREDVGAPTIPASVLWAARLAVAYGAPLDLLYVAPAARLTAAGPQADARARTEARQRLLGLSYALHDAIAEEPLAGRLRVHATVRQGPAAETIATVADENRAHLVTVGTHGRRGASRVLLGSVAEAVVRTAPCPVLVVRDALAEGGRELAEPSHVEATS